MHLESGDTNADFPSNKEKQENYMPKKTLMCLGTNSKYTLVNRFPRIHYLSDKAERKNKMKYRMIKHDATKQHSAPPLRKNFYHFATVTQAMWVN